MIEKLVKYRTQDGQEFDSYNAARAHERASRFRQWCRDNVCNGGIWTSDAVALRVLQDWYVSPRKQGDKEDGE